VSTANRPRPTVPFLRPVRLGRSPAPGTPGGRPKRPAPGKCPRCGGVRLWHTDPDGNRVAVCVDCTLWVVADPVPPRGA
jgi:hypothetical protein